MRHSHVALTLSLVALACGGDKHRAAAKPDTLSDSAATAAAHQMARAATGTTVLMTVTGKDHFDGKLDGRASCTYGGDNSSPTTKVEAFARDAQLSFDIVKPLEGTLPVKSGAVGKHAGPRILESAVRAPQPDLRRWSRHRDHYRSCRPHRLTHRIALLARGDRTTARLRPLDHGSMGVRVAT